MKDITVIVISIFLLLTIFTTDASLAITKDLKEKNSEKYGEAYRFNTNGFIFLHLEGDPYERGYQHGYLLADEIVDNIQRWMDIFPHKYSWTLQKNSFYRLFWNKYHEEYQQEVRGIADGVAAKGGKINGISVCFKDILALNEMYEGNSRLRNFNLYPFKLSSNWLVEMIRLSLKSIRNSAYDVTGACSAFLATGNCTADGRIVAGQSTFGSADEDIWWNYYVAERFNLIVDMVPTEGYRFVMTTAPGMIWSMEDFYENSEGILLLETGLYPAGKWNRLGDPIAVRSRKAAQYSRDIDEALDLLIKNNNNLIPMEWLIGDTKTGEIASIELAFYNHHIERKKDGYFYSCNNPRDDKVRWELTSPLGFGILGRLISRDFHPTERDKKFIELGEKYYGKFDVDLVKKIMSTQPISSRATDCKVTDTKLMEKFGFWAFMGNPNGKDFLKSDLELEGTKRGFTDMPSCGWTLLFIDNSAYSYNNQNEQYAVKQNNELIWNQTLEDGEFGNAIYSSPVKAGDEIYLTSWNGNAYCFNATTGAEIWRTNISWSSESSPIMVNNKIFVGSSEGIHVLNGSTGEIIWENKTRSVSVKPLYYNGFIYFGSHDEYVYGFNAEDEELEWSFKTNGEIHSSPAVNEDILFIGSNDGYLYAINVSSKELKWKFKTGGAVCSSPLVSNDDVYFGSWDNNLYCLDEESGVLKWNFTAGWGIDSSPVIYEESIYFGSRDNNFYSVHSCNGSLSWIFTTNGGIESTSAIYEGSVLFGSSDGRFYSLNSSNGDLEWFIAPSYYIEDPHNYVTKPIVSSPIVDESKIYFGSISGGLYCFNNLLRIN